LSEDEIAAKSKERTSSVASSDGDGDEGGLPTGSA
jgi:hypothetical protein